LKQLTYVYLKYFIEGVLNLSYIFFQVYNTALSFCLICGPLLIVFNLYIYIGHILVLNNYLNDLLNGKTTYPITNYQIFLFKYFTVSYALLYFILYLI
jgi:hypothetical protein